MRNRPWIVLLVVVGVAALVRGATMVAYGPALMFSDSWAYVEMAWVEPGVAFRPDRPSGYPWAIERLAFGGRQVWSTVAVQHLIGLAIGVALFVLLRLRQVPAALALGVASLVLLDAPTIALEQHVLAETLFLGFILGALALTALKPRDLRALVVAGLLLSAATTLRASGLYVIPIWLAFVVVGSRIGVWRTAVCLLAVLVPLTAYAAENQRHYGRFSVTAADGWFLWGRVAEITRCDGLSLSAEARQLCLETERAPRDWGAADFLWTDTSPANRRYGSIYAPRPVFDRSNAVLGELAWAVIWAHPDDYARMVAADLGRLFVPGVASKGLSDLAITFPAEPRRNVLFHRRTRDAYLPDYEPRAAAPSGALRAYQSVVRIPRPLLALCGLLSLLALAALPWRRTRAHLPHAGEAVLFGCSALALLVCSVATSEFVVRYLLPAAPLLLYAGALVTTDLVRACRPRADADAPARQLWAE